MLHTSYGAPLYGIPCRISGAAYAALPQNVELRSSSVMMRAKPKSDTFTLFSLSSKMFSHFKSLYGHRNRLVGGGSLLGGSYFRLIPPPTHPRECGTAWITKLFRQLFLCLYKIGRLLCRMVMTSNHVYLFIHRNCHCEKTTFNLDQSG